MRKLGIVLLVLGLTAIALIIAILSTHSDGPMHNGQSLYQWLSTEIKSNTALVTPAQADEAYHAVIQIGTNALPWLVSSVQHTPGTGPDHNALVNFIHNLPSGLNPNHFLCRHLPGREADYRSGLAIEGFRLLGTNALPALPDLTSIMNTGGTSAPARYALFAISHMGQPALPTIVAVITNTNHPQRAMAVAVVGSTMWYLGTNAAGAVPALTQCLNDPDPKIANYARSALSFIAGERKPRDPPAFDAGSDPAGPATNTVPH
jgi:hypothetical protein